MRFMPGLVLLALVATSLASAADPPDRINYQGVLRNSADEPLDGDFPMTFRLFDALAGGNEILVDTHAAVTVSNGLFNVEIGSGSVTDGSGPETFTTLADVFAQHTDLYLEVEVSGETLSPRTPIAAAGYALNARRVRGVEMVADGPLDLYVDDDTCPSQGSGTVADPFCSIQVAVDHIPAVLRGPVTVHIANGTYHEAVLIDHRLLLSKDSTITLLGNEASPQSVVIDGQGMDETGISILGVAEIRGLEVRDFLDAGIEFGLIFTAVDNCRILNNGLGLEIGNSPGEIGNVLVAGNTEGVEIANSLELIINGGVFDNNSQYGLSISASSVVYIEDCEVTNNLGDGIRVHSGGHLILDPSVGTLLVDGNTDLGVAVADNSSADFGDRVSLTIQGSGADCMQASYHSTIRGYENGTTCGCTADAQSTCEP